MTTNTFFFVSESKLTLPLSRASKVDNTVFDIFFITYDNFSVPPAELESVLLQHPDIADTGVVGIDSHVEATELPR